MIFLCSHREEEKRLIILFSHRADAMTWFWDLTWSSCVLSADPGKVTRTRPVTSCSSLSTIEAADVTTCTFRCPRRRRVLTADPGKVTREEASCSSLSTTTYCTWSRWNLYKNLPGSRYIASDRVAAARKWAFSNAGFQTFFDENWDYRERFECDVTNFQFRPTKLSYSTRVKHVHAPPPFIFTSLCYNSEYQTSQASCWNIHFKKFPTVQ